MDSPFVPFVSCALFDDYRICDSGSLTSNFVLMFTVVSLKFCVHLEERMLNCILYVVDNIDIP